MKTQTPFNATGILSVPAEQGDMLHVHIEAKSDGSKNTDNGSMIVTTFRNMTPCEALRAICMLKLNEDPQQFALAEDFLLRISKP